MADTEELEEVLEPNDSKEGGEVIATYNIKYDGDDVLLVPATPWTTYHLSDVKPVIIHITYFLTTL